MADEPQQPADQNTGIPPELQMHVSAWDRIQARANSSAAVISFIIFLVVAGAVGGYFFAHSAKNTSKSSNANVTTLSPAEISQLSQVGSTLGSNNQNLNIAANTLFSGNASVAGTLTVGGHFNANGPVTLSQLNITGNTATTGLTVGTNLSVSGSTTLQGALNVNNVTSINSNLNVSGNTSLGSLSAGSIAVKNLSISGPLTISHLISQGPTPNIAANNVGGGSGTVNISGNDTAGQININTGNSSVTPGSQLATITFRASYGSTVHVVISPVVNGQATQYEIYITPSSTGFTISTAAGVPPGAHVSFDYIVVQ